MEVQWEMATGLVRTAPHFYDSNKRMKVSTRENSWMFLNTVLADGKITPLLLLFVTLGSWVYPWVLKSRNVSGPWLLIVKECTTTYPTKRYWTARE